MTRLRTEISRQVTAPTPKPRFRVPKTALWLFKVSPRPSLVFVVNSAKVEMQK
jgi:hypothetical protein